MTSPEEPSGRRDHIQPAIPASAASAAKGTPTKASTLRLNRLTSDDETQIHHAGGNEGAAGEQVRALFALRAAGEDNGGGGGGVGTPENRGHDYTALFPGSCLQDIAAIGNGADRNHDEPGFEGVDQERSKFLVGQDGQNDGAEQKKLGKGEDFLGSDALAEVFETILELQQQHAGHAECGGDPELVVIDERADDVGGETGHFGGDSGSLRSPEFVAVRQPQKCSHNGEADGHRHELRARQQGDRVAQQADQRKRAHAAEAVVFGAGFVFLPIQSDQERKEQHEDDLDAFRRKPLVKLRGHEGLSLDQSRWEISVTGRYAACMETTDTKQGGRYAGKEADGVPAMLTASNM